jgi:hypothetical protein
VGLPATLVWGSVSAAVSATFELGALLGTTVQLALAFALAQYFVLMYEVGFLPAFGISKEHVAGIKSVGNQLQNAGIANTTLMTVAALFVFLPAVLAFHNFSQRTMRRRGSWYDWPLGLLLGMLPPFFSPLVVVAFRRLPPARVLGALLPTFMLLIADPLVSWLGFQQGLPLITLPLLPVAAWGFIVLLVRMAGRGEGLRARLGTRGHFVGGLLLAMFVPLLGPLLSGHSLLMQTGAAAGGLALYTVVVVAITFQGRDLLPFSPLAYPTDPFNSTGTAGMLLAFALLVLPVLFWGSVVVGTLYTTMRREHDAASAAAGGGKLAAKELDALAYAPPPPALTERLLAASGDSDKLTE